MRDINKTIRVGVLGNVDSGKTTLVGVLTKLQGELDDGRGYARSKVFTHKHEKETGRTSSVVKETIRRDYDKGSKVIEFVDLAGHEKYFKTTIKGICNNCIDYVLLLVNGNMGTLTRMTLEHIYFVLSLRIPLFVLITKTDMTPDNVLKETLDNTKKLLKKYKLFSHVIQNEKDLEKDIIKHYMEGDEAIIHSFVPILKISNKSGENIELLKDILFELNQVYKFSEDNNNKKYIVNNIYNINGVGIVLSGICIQGKIKKGDVLSIMINRNQIKIQVKSIHDDFCNLVDELYLGETGCIAIKILDKNQQGIFKKRRVRNGIIVMEKPEIKNEFIANILVHTTSCVTIMKNYQPIINTLSINQAAIIERMSDAINQEEKQILRGQEKALVKFKFAHYPEYINKNQFFVFRDGKIKGIGKVVE